MEKQQFNFWNHGSAIGLVILVTVSLTAAGNNKYERPLEKEPVGVFLNNKQIHVYKDSLEVTAKGTLVLSTLSPELQKKNVLGFRIVIRRRIAIGDLVFPNHSVQYTTQDERFLDGKVFNSIEVEQILPKTRPGDQLIIVPVDRHAEYKNSNEPMLINVIGDKC